jgi:hypothetical protein
MSSILKELKCEKIILDVGETEQASSVSNPNLPSEASYHR